MSSDDGKPARRRSDGHPPGLIPGKPETGSSAGVHAGWVYEPAGGLTEANDSGQLWWQMHGLIQGLGLQGLVRDDLLRHWPDRVGYVGVEFGSYVGYWAIHGDVASALHLDSDIITFVSGVNLGIDLPASGTPELSIKERDEIRLHAGAIAAFIGGMPPAGDREIRVRFGIPHQQRWLQMLVGADPDAVLEKGTLARLEHVTASSLLAEECFRETLKEMLGDRYEHVEVYIYDEFYVAGKHLFAALGNNQVPTLAELAEVLRRSPNGALSYAVGPEFQEKTGFPGWFSNVDELIELAHAATMAWAAQDGLAIAVGMLDATGETLDLARDLAWIISPYPRWFGLLQVNPVVLRNGGDVPTPPL